jgi:hypothetical protein
MRAAYTWTAIGVIVIIVGAYFLANRAEAPGVADEALEDNQNAMLTLSSPAFTHNDIIPSTYTCDGEGVSPPLAISGVPDGTESLVLLMDDPDIPEVVKADRGIEKFDHWVLYNIPPETTEIPEGASAGSDGLSSRGEPGYVPSCPPPQYEPAEHRYFFRLYALDATINFVKAPTLDEVRAAIEGHILEEATLVGRYERTNQ